MLPLNAAGSAQGLAGRLRPSPQAPPPHGAWPARRRLRGGCPAAGCRGDTPRPPGELLRAQQRSPTHRRRAAGAPCPRAAGPARQHAPLHARGAQGFGTVYRPNRSAWDPARPVASRDSCSHVAPPCLGCCPPPGPACPLPRPAHPNPCLNARGKAKSTAASRTASPAAPPHRPPPQARARPPARPPARCAPAHQGRARRTPIQGCIDSVGAHKTQIFGCPGPSGLN